ncbi:hypothetical protein DL764_010904 [Monosporascus ibericus]|uniref:MOSC domain-containing protein n=1 Tax=Monosporascus ibericus TaxID=155417 RepID=A0A4Q4SRZ0_9PEZI|nr:hypothetical protein DL764_010904 [Monosporascus ibericus]
MKITELYIYPIKSLRPLSVQRARLRREGPEHDRCFMLLKVEADGSHRNIQPVHFPESVLFHQVIEGDSVVVTYRDPSETKKPTPTLELQELQGDTTAAALRVPLRPSIEGLAAVDVRLFGSTTTAYRMGDPYDAWFSSRFGYKVILVYIGDRRRPVLAHSPNNNNEKVPRQQRSWLSAITSYVTGSGGEVGEQQRQQQGGEEDFLTFSEAAPFLVTSRASLRDVNSRLPQSEDVDMMVFRPNIVVDDDYDHDSGDGNQCDGDGDETQATMESGGGQQQQRGGQAQTETQTPASPQPKLEAWDEDFWGELRIGGSHRLALTANCARCLSINIDYDTGRPAEGERGAVLKKLMADRRVDSGNRWSPIFGRYAFLLPTSPASDEDAAAGRSETMAQSGVVGADVAVGDEVVMTRRISGRDVWSWPKST